MLGFEFRPSGVQFKELTPAGRSAGARSDILRGRLCPTTLAGAELPAAAIVNPITTGASAESDAAQNARDLGRLEHAAGRVSRVDGDDQHFAEMMFRRRRIGRFAEKERVFGSGKNAPVR